MRRPIRWTSIIADALVVPALVLGIATAFFPGALGIHEVEAVSPTGEMNIRTTAPSWLFPGVFLAIMWTALRAVAHAEAIAVKVREPFGTLILTLSAVFIEVALVLAVMMTGSSEDTVARDTMFAALMVILNGLVGVALIAGALRKREQAFNSQSSNSYLAVIAALCTMGLILPRFTTSQPGGYMSDPMNAFVAGASLAVYLAFLALQTSSHRVFFVNTRETGSEEHHGSHATIGPLWFSIAGLVVSLATVVLLAESLGGLLVSFLASRFLPPALQGVVIAFLILLPEGIGAIRSALGSNIQRTVNILHGSALSTIGLTIPAVLISASLVGRRVELGLEAPEICLLVATIFVSVVNFGQGRTNMLQGVIHATLFALWIVLLVDTRQYIL